MKKLGLFLLLILGPLGLVGCNSDSDDPPAVDYSATIQKAAALIEQEMRDNQIVGLSIALVDGQNVVWQQGFGYADRAKGVAANADTIYQIGSISKLFTATAVMQLAERGKLNIDRPLSEALPGFSIQSRFPEASAAGVTPRRMMTHHSGLPNDYPAHMFGNPFRPEVADEFLAALPADWLSTPPDTAFSYSNIAITLLGLLVEAVSGQDFIAYADQQIFAPLGMPLTSFAPRPEMASRQSRTYVAGEEFPTYYANTAPAGSVLSSVAEMTHFMRAMLAEGRYNGQTILQPATLRQMWTPQNLHIPLDFDTRIGLNWILSDPELGYAGQIAWHNGGTISFNSHMTLLPEHQLGIIALSNSPNEAMMTIVNETLKSALAAKTGLNPPPAPSPSPPQPLPPETLERYAGHYAGADQWITMTVAGDQLAVKTSRDQSFLLKPLANGGFAADLPALAGMEFFFETVAGYRVVSRSERGSKSLFLTRIAPPAPRQAWRNRAGVYIAENYGPDYFQAIEQISLLERDGALILSDGGNGAYALDTLNDTEAVVMGLGRNYGLTVRMEPEGSGERLIYAGVTFRKSVEPTAALQRQPATLRNHLLD